jgi:hypothetical protein
MRATLALLLFLPLLLWVGCGEDEPTTPDQDEITAVIDQAGHVVPPAEKDEVTDTSSVVVGDYKYVYETHDVVDNIDNIVYLGLNDDIVWPGNIVRGDRANSYVYEPIAVARGALTLSLSLETSTTGESITKTVADPKLSTVRQGISDLLKEAIVEGTYVPAKVEFSKQEVFSASQMSLFVGADVSYGVGSLHTAFDWQSTNQKTKIVAKYKQIYYSIDMDTPATAAALLSPNIALDDVRSAFPPGSMPIYVAGVSYGVMAIFTIETEFSYEEMNLAIDGAYQGIVDVKLSSGFTAREMLQQSNVRVVVYGGSTLGLGAIEEGFEGFMRVVEASREFNNTSPGVPLVYKFRHCSDNTLALVTLTSQYTLVRPLQLRQRVRLTINSFYCEMADDEGVNTVDMDRFQVKAWAWDRNSESDPGVQCLGETSVYYWSTAGEHNMDAGDTWNCSEPNSVDITFDTANHDFDYAKLHLWGWARDYDGIWSADENGYAEVDFYGNRFFENGGAHSFQITSADFRFKVNFTLTLVN